MLQKNLHIFSLVNTVQTKQTVPFLSILRTPSTLSKVVSECEEEDMREKDSEEE